MSFSDITDCTTIRMSNTDQDTAGDGDSDNGICLNDIDSDAGAVEL